MQTTLDFNIEQSSFTGEHIAALEKFNKYEKVDCEKHFDEVAVNYENIYTRVGYDDPEKCANWTKYFADEEMLMPEQCKVLDFGCGTGLVGKHLECHDFKNVTGIDVSQNMLDLANEKNCYTDLVKHELGKNDYLDTFPRELRNKFDFVTAAGLVNSNHLDKSIFEQMLIALKKDGYLIFSARFSYLGDYWYADELAELEKQGRIKAVKSEEFFKYDKLNIGVGKFSKTPVKILVYKKTEGDSALI